MHFDMDDVNFLPDYYTRVPEISFKVLQTAP